MPNYNGISYFVYRQHSNNKKWRYEIRYKDGTGKIIRKTKQGFEMKKEALNYVTDELNKLVVLPDVTTTITTFGEVFDTYINKLVITGRSNSTIEVRKNLKKHTESLFSKDITSIRKLDVQNLFDNNSHLSKSTLSSIKSGLMGVFNLAKDMELIKENPCDKVKFFANVEKKKKKERVILSKDEIQELYYYLKEFNHDLALICLIQATCGLRFNEAFSLKYSNIGSEITVDQQDGGKSLKTANSYRSVPIPQFTRTEILEFMKKGLNINGKLFNHYKNKVSAIVSLNPKLDEYKKGLTSHGLRHTYGSNLVSDGVDLPTVAKLLGDTLDTVVKVYIHSTDKGIEKAKKILNV